MIYNDYYGPKRLTFIFFNLKNEVNEILIKGPNVKAPTNTVEGFARSQQVKFDKLDIKKTEKGSYYIIKKKITSSDTIALLKKTMEENLVKVPWKKSMRWGSGSLKWIRPLKNVLCLYGTKKINLDKLKESILLQSEILDLKASFSDKAKGVVIESKIDKGKGPVSTILISNGKLKRGDYFICGDTWGKVRAMINHEGKMVNEALPSMPVEILGMNSSAYAGAEFMVTKNEVEAKELTEFRKNSTAQNKTLAKDKTTLFEDVKDKDELNIIIKSDVQGSSEALKMAINKIDHKEVEAKIRRT